MEERKCSRRNKLLAERNQDIIFYGKKGRNKDFDVKYETAAGRRFRFVMDSIQGNGRKEMLKDEITSS